MTRRQFKSAQRAYNAARSAWKRDGGGLPYQLEITGTFSDVRRAGYLESRFWRYFKWCRDAGVVPTVDGVIEDFGLDLSRQFRFYGTAVNNKILSQWGEGNRIHIYANGNRAVWRFYWYGRLTGWIITHANTKK